MSTTMFVTLLTILSVISSLFTEAIKKTFPNVSSTIMIMVLSAVIGWVGCGIAYILAGIPFTLITITTLIIMAPAVWLCATLGYERVMEVVKKFIS